ncbi:hypothetical protein BHE74_00027078 [Ensete ventricosum]|nr:hypothetical protein BHE74_00027078 [Ensete ventricosum]
MGEIVGTRKWYECAEKRVCAFGDCRRATRSNAAHTSTAHCPVHAGSHGRHFTPLSCPWLPIDSSGDLVAAEEDIFSSILVGKIEESNLNVSYGHTKLLQQKSAHTMYVWDHRARAWHVMSQLSLS